jgi:hypothetical protein
MWMFSVCLSVLSLLQLILCLWWVVTSLSPKRLGLDARSLHVRVGFVIEWQWDRFFSEYVENNQQNTLNSILIYFSFLQWLLHVSAKQFHPQGATVFLSEPLQRQYGRRQVRGRMTEPMYVGSVIRPLTCLLPYWHWSGSERNTVAPWGWHCFAETCSSHHKKEK